MSRELGVSQVMISRVEAGQQPTVSLLRRLTQVLPSEDQIELLVVLGLIREEK